MAKLKVAKVNEIPEAGIKKVMVDGEPVALYKVEGKIYATTNICTHEMCELDQNHMMHGDVVECTCHGSQFNIKTGANVLPPAAEPLKIYKVNVEGDEVFVEA
ncbi:non-heme iron oxygenase ferredoxin subunit [Candidatus Curtissbacteria bacterium]|nr:non-heme iron oxygenase ferredoxin subunit [Candidatus Curtissbacteria bacterium]